MCIRDSFNSVSGRGLNGEVAGNKYLAGNIEYMLEEKIDLKDFQAKAEELAGEGKTSMYFANESEVLGIISVKDLPKESSKDAIKLLRDMGKKIIMLTGDNEKTAEAIADEIGVDQTLAGLLPQDKNKEIDKIQKSGKKVLMIVNLKPIKLRGVESKGMILAAEDDEKNLSLASTLADLKSGAKIS